MPADPRCPYCNAHGAGLIAIQPLDQYLVIYCGQCGAIYNILPRPQQKPAAPPPAKTVAPPAPSQKPEPLSPPPRVNPDRTNLGYLELSPALQEAGHADLSKRAPYNPVAIATAIRAAGLNASTMYRHIGIPDGPPQCPTHKYDLVKVIIPPTYPNAGRKVWLCPHGNCNQWWLAE